MHRIDTATKAADLFGAGKHGYKDGDKANGIPATDLDAATFNALQEEIVGVIEGQGIALVKGNHTQLRQAITQMIQSGQRAVIINNATFAPAVTGTGKAVYWDSANNRFDLALADGSAKQNMVGFADVANGNVYALGDAVLFTGLTAGARYYLDSATAGAITTAAPTSNVVSVGIAKGATELFVDVDAAGSGISAADIQTQAKTGFTTAGAAPNFTLTTSPAYGAYAAGKRMRVKFHAAGTTGSNTLNRDGNGAKNLMQYDPSGNKVAAVITAGMLADVEEDGADIVILNPLPNSPSVQGAFKKLVVSSTGGSANRTITADEVTLEDGNGSRVTVSAVNLAVNTAAAGANGLDSGAIAASTWYYDWVIRKPDGTTAGLASLSSTAPTMPAGYTFKARVGAFRTDATGNKFPLGTTQTDRQARYIVGSGNVAVGPQMANGTLGTYPSTYAAIATGNFVPPTASRILVSGIIVTNVVFGVAPNNSYGRPDQLTNPPPLCNNLAAGQYGELLLESSNIYAVSSSTCAVVCWGWTDNL